MREEVSCYSDSDKDRKHKGTPGRKGGWREEGAGRTVGPMTKDCFRTLSWKPVSQRWKVMGEKGGREGNPHSSAGVLKRPPPT